MFVVEYMSVTGWDQFRTYEWEHEAFHDAGVLSKGFEVRVLQDNGLITELDRRSA